jgi:hypothetical protein
MVSPKNYQIIKKNKYQHVVTIPNVQTLLNEEEKQMKQHLMKNIYSEEYFQTYHNYSRIVVFILKK